MVDRRTVLKAGAAAGIACALPYRAPAAERFNLHYAPHAGLFEHSAGPDIVDQIAYAAEAGFTAWEDNDMRGRSVAEQERLGAALAEHGMRMGVFVAHRISWSEPGLTTGDPAKRDAFLEDIRESVEVAKRVNATWMTVVPDHVEPRLQHDFQMAHVVEALKRASAILEPHGLVMVLEPLNFRDHPGMFLTEIPQAYLICKAVGSPACKILFDMYHQQITEGNIIPNIDAAWDEIAYFQVGDVPGRNEPTTGEMHYRNIFRHIHAKGYTGILGMEHGKSRDGVAGERALIDAYRYCDAFL
ncbi:MAG TPA: TIM barrel protein [Woeseiaceae bacterium]|nr:TIM barrel protein [Woeseiaceae bacterium]